MGFIFIKFRDIFIIIFFYFLKFFKIKWSFNLFRDKIIILLKLFNSVNAKVASWYKCEKKGGAKYMLKFCSGWMNIRQNKGGAIIIFLYIYIYKVVF